MQKIYYDGTDQELYFTAVASDLSGAFNGTIDGESLSGAVVLIREYKLSFVEITGTTVLWDATGGYWFVTIPAANITQTGNILVAVSGTGMMNVSIEAEVISSSSGGTDTGGSEKVIPATSISLNSAAKTITLSSPYDTITVEQILSIRNITENQDIYNSKVTHEGKQIHITTPGIIDYDYSGTMVDLIDIIQIIYI